MGRVVFALLLLSLPSISLAQDAQDAPAQVTADGETKPIQPDATGEESAVAEDTVVEDAAESSRPNPDAEARKLFTAGKTAFDSGQFETALAYFEKSYELSKRPALLFNIGTSADRLRDDDRALKELREYRRLVPGARNALSVDSRIRVLEEQIRQREAAKKLKPKVVVVAAKSSKLLPTLLLVVGGASLVTGGVLLGVAVANKNAIDGTTQMDGRNWADYEGKANRVPILSTAGWIALGVGVLSTAIAIVLFTTSKREPKRVELSFSGSHLKLRGTF